MLDIKRNPSLGPSNPGDKLNGPLGFGQIFTDRMIQAFYDEGKGWHDAELVPYAPIPLDPAATALHYAQEIFEGLKAYYRTDGSVGFFRPEKNAERLNSSARRLCMPEIPVEDQLRMHGMLVKEVKDWVPQEHGSALYLRPFMFGTEPFLGVRASKSYMYMLITSPVAGYFASGFNAVKVLVSDEHVRAAKGGIGAAKAGANYAASLLAGNEAKKGGYAQVMYLDAQERRFVEEMGGMNVFFVREGKTLLTPELSGSILPGITRDSILTMAPSLGFEAVQGHLDFNDIVKEIREGKITEAFACGTAAVVTPISHFGYKGEDIPVGGGDAKAVAQKLFDTLTGIQYGKIEDTFGFTRGLQG